MNRLTRRQARLQRDLLTFRASRPLLSSVPATEAARGVFSRVPAARPTLPAADAAGAWTDFTCIPQLAELRCRWTLASLLRATKRKHPSKEHTSRETESNRRPRDHSA
jgi:hypothetical protein